MSSSESPATSRGTARFLALYALAWTPYAALYALGVAQTARPLDGLLSGLTAATVAATLGLGVRVLVLRLRARPQPWWRVAAFHLAVGGIYSACLTSVTALMVRLGAPAEMWQRFVANALGWQFIAGLLMYALLAAVFIGIENVQRLREQERRAARAEALRVRAELQALRAQLNPHVLFNTLHSITALVRTDAAAAERALEQFGLLLRRVLEIHREQREEIPLSEELDLARTFLALERLRLGDRLRVVEEIDSEALECHVLAFSLQPLVENAIAHGIAPLARGGTVRLAAQLRDETLELEVADDGAGAMAERLTASQGVGLQVVRQRLQARFGSAASIDVATAPGEGCRVRLTMPVVVQPLAARSPSAVPATTV